MFPNLLEEDKNEVDPKNHKRFTLLSRKIRGGRRTKYYLDGGQHDNSWKATLISSHQNSCPAN